MRVREHKYRRVHIYTVQKKKHHLETIVGKNGNIDAVPLRI